VFGRSNDQQPVTPALSEGPSPADAGKGRPTPKRKVSEAANKRPLVNTDRKGAAKTDRSKAKTQRDIEYRAMQTGDERNMPAKDRGPVRRFMRDAVDCRWNLGEFFLPVAAVLLVAQFAFANTVLGAYAIVTLYSFVILATFDGFMLWRSVKKRLRAKFGADVALKGAAMYTVLRAFQIRPSRLPKPQVKHGQRPV
jgi:Flp pilus assembly protein TadB